ncbi:MAG: amidase domain-containing protein [Bacillota bacterium]|nr:amidase domain-containing protein [Bacillota bacterium]
MPDNGYDRIAAVEYARKWAFSRNPDYIDFHGLGGDCTNFVSQCLYAGGGVMNFTPIFGWYYISSYNRTASWTGVEYFYNFMVNNEGAGPYATETDQYGMEIGDVIQLEGEGLDIFTHTLLVTRVVETPEIHILVSAHTNDAFMRPLSSYSYDNIRYLHIEGVRPNVV